MLKLQPAQIKALEADKLRQFEDEMVEHSIAFTPPLCEVLGEEQLRIALRQAMGRAQEYGFTYRGPIRTYIELIFLFGSDFDTDPQYPSFTRVLKSPEGQMERAERLYELIMDYQQRVSGEKAGNAYSALTDLSVYARTPRQYDSDHLEAEMHGAMMRIFPQKAAYIGDEGQIKLICEAREAAKRYQFFEVQAEVLMVMLMFGFGHGCIHDPLYPWIQQTLEDKKIVDPRARAVRLQKKALTWLDHVLSGPWGGGRA